MKPPTNYRHSARLPNKGARRGGRSCTLLYRSGRMVIQSDKGYRCKQQATLFGRMFSTVKLPFGRIFRRIFLSLLDSGFPKFSQAQAQVSQSVGRVSAGSHRPVRPNGPHGRPGVSSGFGDKGQMIWYDMMMAVSIIFQKHSLLDTIFLMSIFVPDYEENKWIQKNLYLFFRDN